MRKAEKILLGSTILLAPIIAQAAWTAPTPSDPAVPTNFDNVLNNVINWILGIVGLISVLVIIYGGVMYLTSTGAADRVKSGKDTIKYGIMGLIIAGAAYAIVNVIIGKILV